MLVGMYARLARGYLAIGSLRPPKQLLFNFKRFLLRQYGGERLSHLQE